MPDCFVATDAEGMQHHEGRWTRWSLPTLQGSSWLPGDVLGAESDGTPVMLSAGQLLDELAERIYLAEPVGDDGAARLVRGTSWSARVAADFALDCVDHILGVVAGARDAELPGGGTLGAIIVSARQYLSTQAGDEAQRLGLVSRIAAARRLRRESTAIGDAAFTAATQAEGEGIDVSSDAAWETLAAAHDAVLSAVEAVRHVAVPFLAQREARRYEAREDGKGVEVDEVDTPWGRFAVGGGGPNYVPSSIAARDAAERSRQAAIDLDGPQAGDAERDWQAARLVERLGLG